MFEVALCSTPSGIWQDSDAWIYQEKHDGIRAIMVSHGGRMILLSRAMNPITDKFPDIQDEYSKILGTSESAIYLDGEIVSPDGFSAVQRRRMLNKPDLTPVKFVVFDTPHMSDGLKQRTQYLYNLLPADNISPSWDSYEESLRKVKEQNLEGLIAKRKGSRYTPGRSKNWYKLKEQQTVTAFIHDIATSGANRAFGALHLGLLDENGEVVDIGKCGTGFSAVEQEEILSKYKAGETVIVEIACEGKLTNLRFPSFLRMRSDATLADCSTSQLAAVRKVK
jgi:bifunctional non-homologous end joining protein LigD